MKYKKRAKINFLKLEIRAEGAGRLLYFPFIRDVSRWIKGKGDVMKSNVLHIFVILNNFT